jgi:hypothetical protein
VRASAGTGKSAGPSGGRPEAVVVVAVVGSGRVSLASCFSEHPPSPTATTAKPVTTRTVHCRRTVVLPVVDQVWGDYADH